MFKWQIRLQFCTSTKGAEARPQHDYYNYKPLINNELEGPD